MGLIKAPQGEIKENSEILYHGENILKYNKKQWQHYKGGECAIIFQDALASLNPTMRVGKQIMENLMGHKNMTKQEAAKEAVEMLRMVGIPEPEKRVRQYPHEFSGGMRQRVMIAIAFACDPKILICDEPTTALDVTIQGQILDIIKNLQKKNQTSVIMITHDLGVVANIAQKIAVMYSGIIVESGTCEDIFSRPRHPHRLFRFRQYRHKRGHCGSPHTACHFRRRMVRISGNHNKHFRTRTSRRSLQNGRRLEKIRG